MVSAVGRQLKTQRNETWIDINERGLRRARGGRSGRGVAGPVAEVASFMAWLYLTAFRM